ncbi:MAG: LLM class flavin-dependent oxidoreductase, partial [Pseudolysinimonas sp.]
MVDRIGAERGWPPTTRERFADEIATGAIHAGSPETVARKIAKTVTDLGIQRFDLKYSTGQMSHEHLMTAIELYGTQVIPRVRELLAQPAEAQETANSRS